MLGGRLPPKLAREGRGGASFGQSHRPPQVGRAAHSASNGDADRGAQAAGVDFARSADIVPIGRLAQRMRWAEEPPVS